MQWLRDLGVTVRVLRRQRSFAAPAIVLLALGIGLGTAAFSHPHATEPPRIALTGQEPGLAVVSLVGTVVELHTAAGVTRIVPGGIVPLDPLEAADPNLQRLVEQGFVRIEARGAA